MVGSLPTWDYMLVYNHSMFYFCFKLCLICVDEYYACVPWVHVQVACCWLFHCLGDPWPQCGFLTTCSCKELRCLFLSLEQDCVKSPMKALSMGITKIIGIRTQVIKQNWIFVLNPFSLTYASIKDIYNIRWYLQPILILG